MLQIKFLFKITLFIFFIFMGWSGIAQNNGNSLTGDFSSPKVFIENKGQYNGRNWLKNSEIEYAIANNTFHVFFTKQGLTYRFDKSIRNHGRNKHDDSSIPKRINISELIHNIWLNANGNVKIIAEDKSYDYYSYAIRNPGTKGVYNINYIDAYQKLIYKNIYNGIDVIYKIDHEIGMKYSLIVHPGADPANIKMKYVNSRTNVGSEYISYWLDKSGQLIIKSSLGAITELEPYVYYRNSKKEIPSGFRFENNILSFDVEDYDNSQEIIIDPWVVSPNFTTSTAVWEVETDGAGNVYVIGGETPMELKKYNSAGALQWTYTTPWDTASVWLGTLATDNSGTSYITSGTAPAMERVDNNANMIWHNDGGGGLFDDEEWWSITFNCDKTKLIVGGTILNMLSFPNMEAYATIFDMDINNGNVLGSQNFAYTDLSVMFSTPVEVRSISSSKGAKYIFLTHNDVGAINQNIGVCPNEEPIFQVDNGHHLSYKCENYLPATQNGGGLKALVANDQFFYTHSGDEIHKRALSNGSLISSASIPGGSNQTDFLGEIYVENSGLDVDNCGNVYAGSTDRIVKYDANLNILAQFNVPFTVYDVSVNSNGEVIAVGAQYDNQSTNRNGRIQSVSLSACAQYALVCCDANICPVDTFCSTDPPVTLTSSTPGGTWSGTGITNPATGVFNPSVSGAGIFTIVYTLACGSDSTTITVNACATLTACQETNGNITVSGGTGPYSWDTYIPASTIPITNQATCESCGYTWFFGQCLDGMFPVTECNVPAQWSNFATGTTVTPPGTWPIRVTDIYGNTLEIANISTLPYCSSCPTLTITTNITSVQCYGQSSGSFTASTTGGASPYDYVLENSVGTIIATYNNITGTQIFSGLAAGTYTLNVSDDNNCPGTVNVTITQPAPVSVNLGNNITICSNQTAVLNAGAGFTSYSWNNGATTQTITVSAGGQYSVTVTNSSGCTGTDQVNVTVNAIPNAEAGNNQTICNTINTTLTASGGTSYLWSTGSSAQTITVSPAGTTMYYVTVTANGCSAVDSVTVYVSTQIVASITATIPSVCAGQSTQLEADGGTIYYWNTGETTQIITVSPPATTTYSVTVSDPNGCTGTAQIQIDVTDSISVIISPPTICTGESAQLTASGGTSFLWSTGETTQSIIVSPPVTTTYSVTVTDIGCSGSTTVTVTVYNTPVANAGSDQTICAGQPAILTASGGTTYQWNTGSTLSSITVYPLSTTTYYVTVSQNGCSDDDDINITVNSSPQVDLGTDLTICTGSAITLSAGSGDSYSWSQGSLTQSITVTPVVTTIYSVTVTTNGCSSSDAVTITVNSTPSADAGPNQSVCQGASVTLTATGGTSYLWSTQATNASINVSPLQTTTYYVTITQNNCTGTDSVTVTVGAAVNPVITALPSTICESQSSVLTATGGSQFLWSTGETTQSITVSPSNSTIYTVTVSESGCSGTTNIQIVVNPGITAISSPATICQGESAILTVSSGDSYIWSTGATTQIISVSPAVTTTYYVTVSSITCTDSAEVAVTVNSLPVANAGLDKEICSGSSVTLTATGGGTYTWSNSMTGPSITFTPQTSATYIVTVTNAEGCTSSDGVIVLVNPSPIANAGSDRIICEGDNVQLNATGGISYLWSPASGLSSAIIPNPIASPLITTVYTVSVTNQNGCSDIDVLTITVNPELLVDLEILVSPSDTICKGDEITFTAVPTNPGTNPVYQWKVNNLDVGTNSPIYTTMNLNDSSMVSCILTSSEQCVINNPAIYAIPIRVFPLPKIDIDVDNTKGCQPLSVHFQATSSPSGTYYWDLGDNSTATGSDFTHVYSNAGFYDVTVTVTTPQGCSNSVEYQNIIQVYPLPESEFYAEPEVVTLIRPQINIANYTTGSYVDVCILGDGDTITVLGGYDFYHLYLIPGQFHVILISYSGHGCIDSTSLNVTVKPEYTFYAPSAFTPENDDLNNIFCVKGTGIDANNFRMYIYDRWGEVIYETDKFDSENPELYGWDGRVKDGKRPAPPGTYTWLVIFKDLSGVEHKEAGAVTLIR
ncbi:MAG: gliding motility-associated C-terminal domain-containing protein [Bacteroidia bacterium]|nr:gliding motility-associated C-terminal domain-containing protein [Bacteroidia bacterium]